MARQNIEEMLKRKVNKLREGEKAKKEELIQIQKTGAKGRSIGGKKRKRS